MDEDQIKPPSDGRDESQKRIAELEKEVEKLRATIRDLTKGTRAREEKH